MITRRRFLSAAALLGAFSAAGCTDSGTGKSDLWHGGRIFLATGNTTGVYYQLGGGYADIISKNLPGYEARAEPTGASGSNITRVVTGDMEIAFSLADTAADAAAGRGDTFKGGPQPIRALAKIYNNYTHMIVRSDAKITKLSQLKGKRVSTGSAKSGTEVIATRLITSAGLDPDKDVKRLPLSLPQTVDQMRAGKVDALFFSGGLPTPGIVDLMSAGKGKFVMLPLDDQLSALNAKYGAVYTTSKLPKDKYGTPEDVPTITVANLLVVNADMPDKLAYDLTRLLFEHQAELGQVHPEGKNFDKQGASTTDPVPLHPGASRYYQGG